MSVKIKHEAHVSNGMYCLPRNDSCCRYLNESKFKPFCELFLPYLDKDNKGKILKCEKCLLATREALVEG